MSFAVPHRAAAVFHILSELFCVFYLVVHYKPDDNGPGKADQPIEADKARRESSQTPGRWFFIVPISFSPKPVPAARRYAVPSLMQHQRMNRYTGYSAVHIA